VTLFVSALTMVASVIYAKVLTGRSSPASEA
jgi:hypothetical protein